MYISILGTTGCLCAAAYYIDEEKNSLGYYTVSDEEKNLLLKEENVADRQICKPCPEGADCSVNGALLTNLTATPGYTSYQNCKHQLVYHI